MVIQSATKRMIDSELFTLTLQIEYLQQYMQDEEMIGYLLQKIEKTPYCEI